MCGIFIIDGHDQHLAAGSLNHKFHVEKGTEESDLILPSPDYLLVFTFLLLPAVLPSLLFDKLLSIQRFLLFGLPHP